MSEMVERVARAIVIADAHDKGLMGLPPYADELIHGARFDGHGNPMPVPRWHLATPVARAAIAAMREPTEAMLAAGLQYVDAEQQKSVARGTFMIAPGLVFQTMIDAALEEK